MAFDVERLANFANGIRIDDPTTGLLGAIYCGGPNSPLGNNYPAGTMYLQPASTGATIWFKTGNTANDWSVIAGSGSTDLHWFGDGSDTDPNASSGTITLTRSMYYANLTLSGTAILNCAGFKIYVKGTCSIAGSAVIRARGNNAGNASGQTGGTAGAAFTGGDSGNATAGFVGATGANGGLVGSSGNPGTAGTSGFGLGNAGGAGGNAGSGTGGAAGTYVFHPERVVRHDFLLDGVLKSLGQGGGSGGGGASSAGGTGGGGGGSGGGGGQLQLFSASFNNASSLGVDVGGGNGGNGGNSSGNATSGGGGGGGGGGYFQLVTKTLTALGNINYAGGNPGTPGTGASLGQVGIVGGTGHYGVYLFPTNTWQVA